MLTTDGRVRAALQWRMLWTWYPGIALPPVHHPMPCRALSPHAAHCAALAERFASAAHDNRPGAGQESKLLAVMFGMTGTVSGLATALTMLELPQGAQTSCQLHPSELAPLVQWMTSMLSVVADLLNHALLGTSASLAGLSAAPVGLCADTMARLLEHCAGRAGTQSYTMAAEEARRCVPPVLRTLAAGLGGLTMPGERLPQTQPGGVSWPCCSVSAGLRAKPCIAMDLALATYTALSYPNHHKSGWPHCSTLRPAGL